MAYGPPDVLSRQCLVVKVTLHQGFSDMMRTCILCMPYCVVFCASQAASLPVPKHYHILPIWSVLTPRRKKNQPDHEKLLPGIITNTNDLNRWPCRGCTPKDVASLASSYPCYQWLFLFAWTPLPARKTDANTWTTSGIPGSHFARPDTTPELSQ
jgi:hypothetical protein